MMRDSGSLKLYCILASGLAFSAGCPLLLACSRARSSNARLASPIPSSPVPPPPNPPPTSRPLRRPCPPTPTPPLALIFPAFPLLALFTYPFLFFFYPLFFFFPPPLTPPLFLPGVVFPFPPNQPHPPRLNSRRLQRDLQHLIK